MPQNPPGAEARGDARTTAPLDCSEISAAFADPSGAGGAMSFCVTGVRCDTLPAVPRGTPPVCDAAGKLRISFPGLLCYPSRVVHHPARIPISHLGSAAAGSGRLPARRLPGDFRRALSGTGRGVVFWAWAEERLVMWSVCSHHLLLQQKSGCYAGLCHSCPWLPVTSSLCKTSEGLRRHETLMTV